MSKTIDTSRLFSAKEMRKLYQLIENGIFLFYEAKEKNASLFCSEFSSNIRTRVLSHCINLQLEEPGVLEQMNWELVPSMEGGYKVPTLIKGDVILTLRQCNSKEELLNANIKYMKRYSKYNYVLSNQLSFFDEIRQGNEKIYAILAYSDLDPVSGELKFVELLFPTETMNGFYDSIDLKPNLKLLRSREELQKDSENIITLNNLKKKFMRKKGVDEKDE